MAGGGGVLGVGGNNPASNNKAANVAAGERILLIPSTHASVKKTSAWHQRPYAGCVVLALFSLFGLACVSLPSFESPGNITVFRVSEADVKVREASGWREAGPRTA